MAAPELEVALGVVALLLEIFPPRLPVEGVQDKLAKWPPRLLEFAGGGPVGPVGR